MVQLRNAKTRWWNCVGKHGCKLPKFPAFPAAAILLEEILDQEKEADHALNELAVTKNKEALEEVAIGAGA
jgi:hypothetical protein